MKTRIEPLRGRQYASNVPLDMAVQHGQMSGANNRMQVGVRSTRITQPGNTTTRMLRPVFPPTTS